MIAKYCSCERGHHQLVEMGLPRNAQVAVIMLYAPYKVHTSPAWSLTKVVATGQLLSRNFQTHV